MTFIIIGVIYTSVSRIRKQQNEKIELLSNLSNEIINAQEIERKRLSRDLHDEVGQILTALSLSLELLKKNSNGNGMAEGLDECKSMVKQTISEVRRVTQDLRPIMLDDFGLKIAILDHAKRFERRTDIETNCENVNDITSIHPDAQTALYRIFIESLNNAYKHANSHFIKVTLEESEAKIKLAIHDDGIGFNSDLDKNYTKAGKGGLGILGMQERIKMFKGDFHIVSSSEGTSIMVELPKTGD